MRKKEEHNLVHQVALCKITNLGAENVDQASLLGLQPMEDNGTQQPREDDGAGLKIVYTRQAERVCLCLKREGSYDVEDDTTEPVRCIFKNTSSETCCLTKYREDLRGNSNIYTPEAEGTCCLTEDREDLQMLSNIYTPEAEGVTCPGGTCCLTKQGRTCDVTSRRPDHNSNKSDKTIRANNVQRAVSLATAMLDSEQRVPRERGLGEAVLVLPHLGWGLKALNDSERCAIGSRWKRPKGRVGWISGRPPAT
ncbi:hypothetical protein EV361DRAFT_980877 [Lentinula raphanica]|uniref:Uncharacterized protein n=1 Tax=Lentinula raphanica TaxID=153919 RepID=A0AA38P9S4_9AGAR|nr:hypothetical protein F5880DRAFT_1501390 [Lentinula raphanica]KAJ3838954.1 hypothetical protein F5878DRAFT_680695 [Lentinula raphanica]KAJ3973039.1 hypothetical protein EV361DRAFT_980877 [Lentinula raphanica]